MFLGNNSMIGEYNEISLFNEISLLNHENSLKMGSDFARVRLEARRPFAGIGPPFQGIGIITLFRLGNF
jgi:hypothetical protein